MRNPILAIALLFAAGGNARAFDLAVQADRVNLRARPLLESEVMGQANFGDTLVGLEESEGWFRVRVPEAFDTWVSAEYLVDGEVRVARLNVRGGPGINYQVVGSLERGDRPTLREVFGEWAKIAPPESASAWVSAEFVARVQPPPPPPEEIPLAVRESPLAEAEPIPEPEVVSVPPMAVVPPPAAPVPPPPADVELIPLEGQGKEAAYEGILSRSGYLFGALSKFRLVMYRGNLTRTECYVRGNRDQLSSLLGAKVRIHGREYWAQGAKEPLLLSERIVILERAPTR